MGGTIRYSSPQSKIWRGHVPPRIDAPDRQGPEVRVVDIGRRSYNYTSVVKWSTFDTSIINVGA